MRFDWITHEACIAVYPFGSQRRVYTIQMTKVFFILKGEWIIEKIPMSAWSMSR